VALQQDTLNSNVEIFNNEFSANFAPLTNSLFIQGFETIKIFNSTFKNNSLLIDNNRGKMDPMYVNLN
jgi:hypothetical protein